MDTLTTRYEQVLERLTRAAQSAKRNPAEITLIAVTKTWPAETVLAAYEVGMRHFGENRPEELAAKRTAVDQALGPQNGITWHLIGTLQSRKTHLAAAHADLFHALDRLKIGQRLGRELAENGRFLPTFLEINISGEASKSGLNVSQWEENATQQNELRTMVNMLRQLPSLPLIGLMTMAPWDAPEPVIRTVFQRTYTLARWLETAVLSASETTPLQLSMGMTDDFEIAIASGATHIRVGRAIFGQRPVSDL